jgi:serine O-acetyltransferase
VIGANAVVITDAPEGSLLVGSPAIARPRAASATDSYSDASIYNI